MRHSEAGTGGDFFKWLFSSKKNSTAVNADEDEVKVVCINSFGEVLNAFVL